MTADGQGPTRVRPKSHRSRITNGKRLLPSVHPQSVWARCYRDTLDKMIAHVGGEGCASEPQHMIARDVAVLHTELLYQADKIGTIRQAGNEPDDATVERYSRIAANRRRLLEALGLERTARDITPDIATYSRMMAERDET